MSGRRARRERRAAIAKRDRSSARASSAAAAVDPARLWLVSVALAVGTAVAYTGVWRNAFVAWDDPYYVSENPHVLAGFTWRGVAWAFTSTQGANWHPVTWLSHMLDVQLFGASPAMHHTVGLVLHILNAVLLLVVMTRMTGRLWRSAFVAALFAVHPLHVESVAWASERKDVLSTFFWMLTMLAYLRYSERPGIGRYLVLALAFALGLMSKAMLVTLPFALLLLDFWPLERYKRATWSALVREKLPLVVMVVAVSLVTYLAQQSAGAVQQLGGVSLGTRLANALLSYVRYLGKAIWPSKLAALYPFTGAIEAWQVAGAVLVLAAASYGAYAVRSRRPYVTVGWFWYLGTLVPVIGFVQVGYQAMADRYTYIPLIGIFIIVAWAAAGLAEAWHVPPVVLRTGASAVLLVCAAMTHQQVAVWHDGVSLWQHTVAVTERNFIARTNLGYELAKAGRVDEAVEQYRQALEISPNYALAREDLALAYVRLGNELFRKGDVGAAVGHFQQALRLEPTSAEAHNNLGVALASRGSVNDAIGEFNEALRLNPAYVDARNNLARATQRTP